VNLEAPVDRALLDHWSATAVLGCWRQHFVCDDSRAHEQDSTGVENWMWEYEPDEDEDDAPAEMADEPDWTESWREGRRIDNLGELLSLVE
jgi:hypothetical protein